MIVNGQTLLSKQPIEDMLEEKVKEHGVSHGLSEVGYDLRVKQEIRFTPPDPLAYARLIRNAHDWQLVKNAQAIRKAFFGYTRVTSEDGSVVETIGRTALASSIEKMTMPTDLWGELRNKSTHARCFIDATIGTDMEPNWKGYLTIEIIFHRNEPMTIPAGSGIAKAVFHEIKHRAEYDGKYQNQEDKPVAPIFVE